MLGNEGLNVIRLFPEFDNQRYPKCFTRKRTVYVFLNLALAVFSEGLRPYDFRCCFSILRPRAKRITFSQLERWFGLGFVAHNLFLFESTSSILFKLVFLAFNRIKVW